MARTARKRIEIRDEGVTITEDVNQIDFTGASREATAIDRDVTDDVDPSSDGYLQNIVEDTTPQLGGDLDGQSNSLNNILNLDLEGYLDLSEIAEPSALANTARLYAFDQNGETRLSFIDGDGTVTDLSQDNTFVARNTTGSTLNKGQVVYVSAQTGSTPEVALAKSDSPTTMPAVAVLNESIENNGFGKAIKVGIIEDIDTSAFNVNDEIFVSATTAGAFTNTRPPHPHTNQSIGRVLVSGVGNGSIQVNIEALMGDELGTQQNTYGIGDGTAGTKSIAFKNGSTGTLSWTPTASRTLTLPDSTGTLALTTADHGGLTGLTDDDHTQYALLAGRSGTNDFTGNITATGKIGIGGTPVNKFDVFASASSLIPRFKNSQVNSIVAFRLENDAQAWDIRTTGADRLVIFDTTSTKTIAQILPNATSEALLIGTTETVFNDGGADQDFRVEGVGQANALFVQGSDGRVGIGKVPTNKLNILSEGNATNPFLIDATGSSAQFLVNQTAGGDFRFLIEDSTGTNQVQLHSNGDTYFTGGNVGIGTSNPTEILTVAPASGNATLLFDGASSANIIIDKGNDASLAQTVFRNAGTQKWAMGIPAGSVGDFAIGTVLSNPAIYIDTSSRVGIGTASPTADAKLDIGGTDGAFMPPRLTTTQRNALTASNGMLIYNTTNNRFEGYENGSWVDL